MKLQRIIILALGLCAPALFGMNSVEEDLNLVITQLAAQWEFPLESMKAVAGNMLKSFQNKFAATPKITLMQEQLTKLLAVQKKYKPGQIAWVKQQCELKDAQELFLFIYYTNQKSPLAGQRAEYFKVRDALRKLAPQHVPAGNTISTSTLSDAKNRYAQTHQKNVAEIEQTVIEMKKRLEEEFRRPVEDKHLVGIIEGALNNNISLEDNTEKVIQRYRELKPPRPPSQSNVVKAPLKPAGSSADAATSAQKVSEKPPTVNTPQTATTPPSNKEGALQSSATQSNGHAAPQPEGRADKSAPQADTNKAPNSVTDQGTTKTGSGFESFVARLNNYKRRYLIGSAVVAVSALAAVGVYWYFGNKKKEEKPHSA